MTGYATLEEALTAQQSNEPTSSQGYATLEEALAVQEPQQQGFLDATRSAIRGEEPQGSLPVNIGAEMIANLPTELGAAAGLTRGLMAAPAARGALQGVQRGLPAGPLAAAAYGLAGAGAGALAEQTLQQGPEANTLLGFANPLQNVGAIPQATQDALWTVAGGMGFPLLLSGMGALGRGLWNRLRGTGTPGAEVLQTTGARGFPSDMTPEQRAAFNQRAELSEEFNVPYTYGELTGDRALMQNRESIMRALPGSADPMQGFLQGRARQIQESVLGVANDMLPEAPRAGFARAGEAAVDTINTIKKRRTATTKPMYDQVFSSNPRMRADGFVEGLQSASQNVEAGLKKIYDKTIADIQSAAKDGLVPAEKLHSIQSRLNARAEQLTKDSQQKRVYSEIGQNIKSVLDSALPGYRDVSDVYKGFSQRLNTVRDATRIGKMADADRVDVANRVESWFRGNVQPEELRDVKRIWREELPADRYAETMQGLRAAFLKNVVENLRPNQSGESVLNVGGKIAQALGGDPTQAGGIRTAQLLDELYTPAQREKLNRMLKLLDDTSQILSIKSPTQPRMVAEEMQRTVGEDVLQELGQGATEAAIGGGMGALNWMLRSSGRIRDKVTRRRAREMKANEMYAQVLNQGTTATIRHFDQLERAVRRSYRLAPDAAREQLLRAWGTVMGAQVTD